MGEGGVDGELSALKRETEARLRQLIGQLDDHDVLELQAVQAVDQQIYAGHPGGLTDDDAQCGRGHVDT